MDKQALKDKLKVASDKVVAAWKSLSPEARAHLSGIGVGFVCGVVVGWALF